MNNNNKLKKSFKHLKLSPGDEVIFKKEFEYLLYLFNNEEIKIGKRYKVFEVFPLSKEDKRILAKGKYAHEYDFSLHHYDNKYGVYDSRYFIKVK